MSYTLIQSVTVYYQVETNDFRLGAINGTSLSGTITDYANYKYKEGFIRYSPNAFGPKPRKEIWRIGDKDVSYEEMLNAIKEEHPKLLEDRKKTVLWNLEKGREFATQVDSLNDLRKVLEAKLRWNSYQLMENSDLWFETADGCRLIISPTLEISIKDVWGVDVNHWLRINKPLVTV